MQPETPYVAPARYPLTRLHIPDPAAEADLFSDVERIDGYTICGLPFLESELWTPLERREGDAVCWVCEAEGRVAGPAGEPDDVADLVKVEVDPQLTEEPLF